MKTTTTLLGDDRARVDVEVPPDRVEHDLQHTLHHLAERVRVPGFRKGRAPERVVLQRLGRDEVMAETVSHSLGDWYADAISRTPLNPVGRPEIRYDALPDEGEPFSFSVEVQLRPRGRLPETLVLEAPRHELETPDEAVEAELERLREEGSPLRLVEDRPAQEGDYVELDVIARAGERPLPEMAAHGYQVRLGDERVAGPVAQVVPGMRPGEHREVEIELPEDHPDRRLRGKPATVDVELRGLRERDPVPLDDELARRVSEFDSLAELREDITSVLRAAIEREIEGRYRAAVLDELGRAVEVSLPPELVEERTRELVVSVARAMERRGVPLEALAATQAGGLAGMLEQLRPEAIEMLRRDIALEAFADREGIAVEDAQLEHELREAAAADGVEDVDEVVKELMASDAKERAREELRQRLALDRAVAMATPIDPERHEARERLWTPEKEAKEKPTPKLWTPGG